MARCCKDILGVLSCCYLTGLGGSKDGLYECLKVRRKRKQEKDHTSDKREKGRKTRALCRWHKPACTSREWEIKRMTERERVWEKKKTFHSYFYFNCSLPVTPSTPAALEGLAVQTSTATPLVLWGRQTRHEDILLRCSVTAHKDPSDPSAWLAVC